MGKGGVKKSVFQKHRWLAPLCFAIGLTAFAGFITLAVVNDIEQSDYIVDTNAFFAPFEYYEGSKIAGVDVDIMDRVAKKMDKTISIKNVDFSVILDNVSNGKLADAGVAGLTITEARAKKVDFSIPYYTSTQYVVYNPHFAPTITNNTYITWEALAGKPIGVQNDTTGYLFTNDEIENGVLANTHTDLKRFESAQLAADGINAHLIDIAIIDELPAKFIVSKNPDLACLPLYRSGAEEEPATPVAESYAIAVNKNRPEFLAAINDVLTEMVAKDEVNQLVRKHMGLE